MSDRLYFSVPDECDNMLAQRFLRDKCGLSARIITRLKREKDGILMDGKILRTASFCFLTRRKPLIFNFSPPPSHCFFQVFLSELLGSSHEKGLEGLRDGLGMPSGWTLNFVHPEGVFCRASLACNCRTYFRTIIFTVRPSARRTMLMPLVGDCSCRPSGV